MSHVGGMSDTIIQDMGVNLYRRKHSSDNTDFNESRQGKFIKQEIIRRV